MEKQVHGLPCTYCNRRVFPDKAFKLELEFCTSDCIENFTEEVLNEDLSFDDAGSSEEEEDENEEDDEEFILILSDEEPSDREEDYMLLKL